MHMRSFTLEHSIANLVVSYIRFNAYDNGMGTSLIASLATHRSISRYVASLFAPKSHSSRREQNASLIAWSSSFAYANNGFRSSAQWPSPRAFGPVVDLEFPILVFAQSSLFACGNNGFHSMPGIPAPLARYHTIVICKGNHIKPLRHKKSHTKIPKYSNT